MKLHSLLIVSLAFIAPILHASEPTETKTLTTLSGGNANTYSAESVVLAEGDRAELVGSVPAAVNGETPGTLEISMANVDFEINVFSTLVGPATNLVVMQLNKTVVAGPATIRLHCSTKSFVTFDIHRAGAPSNASPIPQEAGENFNVILEQSSDLLNWTPANPGTYTGTEVKRFFRTRIVKLTP